MRCPQCGKENTFDAKFCEHCGTIILEVEATSPPPTNSKETQLWDPTLATFLGVFFTIFFTATALEENWKTLGELKKAESTLYWNYGLMAFLTYATISGFSLNAYVFSKFGTAYASLIGMNLWMVIFLYFAHGRKQIAYIDKFYGSDYHKKSFLAKSIIAIASIIATYSLLHYLLY